MGYLVLLLYLTILPCIVGRLFYTKQNKITMAQQWVYGQFALWALFQVLAAYYVLCEKSLDQLIKANGFVVQVLILLVAIKVISTKNFVNTTWKTACNSVKNAWGELCLLWKSYQGLLIIFLILCTIQILGILFLQVNDGDDAYHMAIANIAESSGNMYTANVYAFGNTTLPYRYALAPFPIWIACLSRMSGIHTLTIAHVVLGIFLVTMSYVIYAQSAKQLFGENKKKCLQFLCIIALLIIFGNTSSHTAESFLLLRSRQGKALVAGIVFPMLVCLILHIGKKLEQKRMAGFQPFAVAMVVILTGFLGSTLGGSLVLLLWSSATLFLAIGYKNCKVLLGGIFSAIPGLLYAVLYLLH